MDILFQIYAFLSTQGPDIVAAIFMVLGGLKVIARYTPFQWDDKALEVAERPIAFLRDFILPKKDEGKK